MVKSVGRKIRKLKCRSLGFKKGVLVMEGAVYELAFALVLLLLVGYSTYRIHVISKDNTNNKIDKILPLVYETIEDIEEVYEGYILGQDKFKEKLIDLLYERIQNSDELTSIDKLFWTKKQLQTAMKMIIKLETLIKEIIEKYK